MIAIVLSKHVIKRGQELTYVMARIKVSWSSDRRVFRVASARFLGKIGLRRNFAAQQKDRTIFTLAEEVARRGRAGETRIRLHSSPLHLKLLSHFG